MSDKIWTIAVDLARLLQDRIGNGGEPAIAPADDVRFRGGGYCGTFPIKHRSAAGAERQWSAS